MKSLSQNYSESHSNTHETFADLVFCALVVLILFVLALTVEVSQRVRGAIPDVAKVEEITAEKVVKLSPEEMEQLSSKLVSQQEELSSLRQKLIDSQSQISNKLAALAGEQRFTGAREPAAFSIAYDYTDRLYYFVPSKDVDDADRMRSGESLFEHQARQTKQLVEVALAARKQRGYSLAETNAILGSITGYQSIQATVRGYQVVEAKASIYYHIMLSRFIAGDADGSDVITNLVERAINSLNVGEKANKDMYPRCLVSVDETNQRLSIAGVQLTPRDLRDILISVSGRGLLLDLEGYDGNVPTWLYEQTLVPAGYVGKTPKI